MARRGLELADVVRAHGARLDSHRGGKLPSAERRVLDNVAACRTAARGGHVERCDSCEHERVAYNSCRDRHCPKCQESTRAQWLERREQDVLPVEYFHVVFTIPHELAAIALQNKDALYDILFRASAETLREIAADPSHLGAEIGFISVLHTWGQNLQHHPHVHCLVPGGGISPDGTRWVACRRGFFLPVRVLSRLFRGKYLALLREAYRSGQLGFHGSLRHMTDPAAFHNYLAPLFEKEWSVYAKPPFGGPGVVLRYLARYANRVAISNSRLVAMDKGTVTFTWKDYRHGSRKRLMTICAVQFLRRFLLHVLPKGFMRIRHYGLLANRFRRERLAQCRQLLSIAAEDEASPDRGGERSQIDQAHRCPACKRGRMVCVLVIACVTMMGRSAQALEDSS